MINLTLHQDARENFDRKANELVSKIAPHTPDKRVAKEPSPMPEPYVSKTIDAKDMVEPLRFAQTDYHGNQVSRFFPKGNRLYGLEGEDYYSLVRLAEAMQKTKDLEPYVSAATLEESIFKWIELSGLGETDKPMAEVVLGMCQDAMHQHEIWIPIPQLVIAHEIQIGKIIMRTITKEVLDQWEADWLSDDPSVEQKVKEMYNKYRKMLQGRASAFMSLVAEPKRAVEISDSETERAIAILRYFDPATQDPREISHCEVLGRVSMGKTMRISTTDERKPVFREYFGEILPLPLTLDLQFISIIRSNGLDTLNQLLTSDNLTDFQEALLNAIQIFSRNALEPNFVGKTIYLLASLESMLLRDPNESIIQNVGERLALYLGDSLDDVKAIKGDFQRIYSHRSKFLHHGAMFDDTETLSRLMTYTWLFFNNLLIEMDEYQTRENLIDLLEDRKLTPPNKGMYDE